MFLTSLSLRGFKSFADRTTLELEPGVTVIVGPNGSGKSNVVDALSWVLGTASPRKVRGGAMSDVIFAGSPTRNAAGLARVEITIDNSDGILGGAGLAAAGSAQGFSEVKVAREIAADGTTAYLINGEEVRALDVQELLSDTGLGRELHTIVGQGQLDAILTAKPEDRRAFIEEAAGILKHRRRRERALRKLEQVDAHIDKLRAILRELRRQLRPLERQAEAANRSAALQAELRDVQVRVAAIDLAALTERAHAHRDADATAADRLTAAEADLGAARDEVAGLEAALGAAEPAAEAAQQTVYRLETLRERLRGTADLVQAKRRHLIEYVEEPLAGRPPDELRAHAGRVDAEHESRLAERDQARVALEAAATERRDAESRRRATELARQAESRRRAEQRERLLRWEGELSALRGAIATAETESGRVAAQLQGLDDRVAEAEAEIAKVEAEIQRLDTAEVALTAALERAEADVTDREAALDERRRGRRELEAERSGLVARAEALRAALAERDGGTAALLESGLDGVLGPVAQHVRVEGDADAAVAAALGPLGEAVVVSTPETARRAVAWLRAGAAGRAVVLAARVGAPAGPQLDADAQAILADAGARPIGDLLTGVGADGDRVVGALRGALVGTYVVRSWDRAVVLQGRLPERTFVTPDGDIAGPLGFAGGSAPERSAVLTATAAEEAETTAAALARELADLDTAIAAAEADLVEARHRQRDAAERLNESDAAITGAAERLARLNRELNALANQRQVVAAQRAELLEVLERDRAAVSELNARGPEVEELPEPDDAAADDAAAALDHEVEQAREHELEARVQLERTTEQLRHLESQAADLRREADEVEAALAAAQRRREQRQAGIARCGDLAAFVQTTATALDRAIAAAVDERAQRQGAVADLRDSLTTARERQTDAAAAVDEVREHRHAAEMTRADVEHQLEQLTGRLRSEFSLAVDEVQAEHPEAASYDRGRLVEREDELVRKLGLLGRVNPLALEEFQALEDRHRFLSDQLDDLRRSKRDLEEVVVAVDDRIRAVFAEAFADVAHEFEQTFSTVFPGGHGRLVLTEPDDMLATGIEVEARPPGKKVTRLSLLSGGERSLTVLAFVFAIFRARPSPFYVLDEVDAALDDVNLQRLLRVIESFRGQAQIILVTHQKRSMEIADVLYGITMGPDAVTKVVAERLHEGEDGDRVPALAATEAGV